MDGKHIPNELDADLASAYARHYSRKATDGDLLNLALFEVHQAMHSLPPHCLPAAGGLPHNEDHANAAAHRGLSFLRELHDRQKHDVAGLVAPADLGHETVAAERDETRPDAIP